MIAPELPILSKNAKISSLELITRTNFTNSGINWTNRSGAKAPQKFEYSELFNQLRTCYKLVNGLDLLKGPL